MTKEELIELYINQNKTKQEIADIFNVSKGKIAWFIEKNNIVKDRRKRDINTISKEELFKYYITENHTRKDACKHFNINTTLLCELTKRYNFTKSYDLQQQNKIKSLRKKYGKNITNVFQLEEIKEKSKNTCLKKYGCLYTGQVEEFRKKCKNTCLEKYGSECFLTSKIGKEKVQNTYLKRYGVSKDVFAKELGKEMAKNLLLLKNQIIGKRKKTCLERYGAETVNQRFLSPETVKILNDKQKMIDFIKENTKEGKKPTISELSSLLKCTISCVQQHIKNWELKDIINFMPNRSSGEEEISVFLKEIGVNHIINDRKIIHPRELDIFVPEHNVAIEYNGTYWHSEEQKEKNFHFNKSKECEEKGIRLIHIYEHEWSDPVRREIIKSLLRITFHKLNNNNRIYARECEIKEITNKEAKPFNDMNHLQGHRNAKITYGLFYKGNLVQLMSFSKNRKYEWEIIRGCPGSNNIVVGGVSKLFKHFVKVHKPKEIFSYCDFNKFDGTGYKRIGMEFIGYTGPDMKWIMPGCEVIERNPTKHKELSEQAIGKLWGAGSKKFLWQFDKHNNMVV